MEKKFRRFVKKLARKTAKYLPDAFSGVEIDEKNKKALEDCFVLVDESMELAAQQYAQMDRIEAKLDYLISRLDG